MKLMVVGGQKAKQYAEYIQGQFSIATNILAGDALETVERMAVLGNVMERVLVLEQAWTLDGVSTDERDIRKRIGDMARQARDRGGNEQYVFLARSPESAQICFEEIYDIWERSAVVLYGQSVTGVLLYELLSTDIAVLRPSLVYRPPVTAVEEPYTVAVEVPYDDVDVAIQPVGTQKRVIKKVRGAAIQRAGGAHPWYAQPKIGGSSMNGKNFGVTDMFSQTQAPYADKGFADESPYVPSGAVDMHNQLRHMFKTEGSVFAPQIQPVATIPVAQRVPVAGDLATLIRTKTHRGYVLAFIGPGGSGSTFMALNCAARIHSAGFAVMFIDGDLTGHSAQYLTRLGLSGDVLLAETDVRTLRAGFSMYSATQFSVGDGRFWSVPDKVAEEYEFIVADIPFHSIAKAAPLLTHASRMAITVDSSNWGIGKAVMVLFNSPVNVAPLIRERGRLVYNRSDKLSSGLFGEQVRDTTTIQNRVEGVFGARASAFTSLPVAAVVGSYASAEEYWYSDRLFSDSPEGAQLFDKVLCGLLG